MGKEEQFDSFYRSTRHALVHQTFALTGDLPASQSAVRDAYVAAWHHWRKASSLEDPQDWVRPRAWRLAQRRHTARIWHRNRGLSDRDKLILDALAKLPMAQRKVLLLTQLAAVPLSQAARELGVTEQVAERNLQSATANFSVNLDVGSTSIRPHLDRLRAAAEVTLPRTSIIRRAGRKRRRAHTMLAVATTVLVVVAAGMFAYEPAQVQAGDAHLVRPTPVQPSPTVEPSAGLPSGDQLLDADQISRLGMSQRWRILDTTNNTRGKGINTICQQTRFADPDGLSALVRSFEANGKPRRSAVQTVEISKSADQSEKTFQTTLGWYAGCQLGRLQLLNAFRVNGIGDEAKVLMVRVWKEPVTTYSVALARIGRVTTTIVSETVGGTSAPPGQITQSLADAVSMLCATSQSEGCAKQPTYRAVPPPPSGEERGILAVADLPPVGRIDNPWVGTKPGPARANPSATTCDRANFVKSGAARTRTRTFLIPQTKLPSRFGLSESYGAFGSGKRAARFLAKVRAKVAKCEDRDLAAKVTNAWTSRRTDAGQGMDMSTWDLEIAISDKESVRFRLGFVRVGNTVAQLTLAPAPHDDMSAGQFRDLLVRSADRLRELGKPGA